MVRRQQRRRGVGLIIAVAALAATSSGCGWLDRDERATDVATERSTATEPSDPLVVHTLTPDGGDEVRWSTTDSDGVRGVAASWTHGGSLREVATRTGATEGADQTSCATWWGPVVRDVQPGVALRVRTRDGETTAITVTQNVWSAARYRFNVHLVDSAATKPLERIGGDWIRGVGGSAFYLDPLPWRMCARADGRTVTVKVWSTSTHPDEPSWDDPDFTFETEVPADWVYEGAPGLYLGHLLAGTESTYSDWTTEVS